MGSIFDVLLVMIAISFLPVIGLGWALKGWRPFLVSLVTLAVFIFFSSRIVFHPLASFVHYFVVLALYIIGGKLRTGKTEDELLSGKPKEEIDGVA